MEESNLRRLLSREASDQAAHQGGAGRISHRSVRQPASKPFKAALSKLRVRELWYGQGQNSHRGHLDG